MVTHQIGRTHDSGSIDSVDVEPSGLIRVNAWTTGDPADLLGVRVVANGAEIAKAHWYRTYRPDVAAELHVPDEFLGLAIEYLAPNGIGRIDSLSVGYLDDDLARVELALSVQTPSYSNLFSDGRVLGRDDIYSHGPPSPTPSAEVLAIAMLLPTPILDFGCGSGSLIRELRSRGLESHGVELRTTEITSALPPELLPHVTIYDGRLPLPFPDKLFASATLIDVIEHVTDFHAVLKEIHRLTREQVVVTVPDMSAIPLCAPHGVVPWHLLEGTQRWFFTQSSLSAAVSRHFRNFQIYRIHPQLVNGTRFHATLVARCWI